MNNILFKRNAVLLYYEQIYTLEEMIFKNKAWTLNMLKIELLCIYNSKTLIIKKNESITGPMPDISTIFIGEKPTDRKKIRLPC